MNTIRRLVKNGVLIFFVLFTLPSYSEAGKTDSNQKPNVIIIVADQMRRAAMGFWAKPEYKQYLNGVSDPVITPNLDALAENGLVLNHAIANYPLCSPFRGMLMSGMYPHKNGVSNNTRKDRTIGLKPEIQTLTDLLFESGYNTALVGKAHWHVNRPLFDEQGDYQGTTKAPGGHFIKETDYDTYIPPGKYRHNIEYWYQNISHVHKNPIIYSNDSHIVAGKKDGQQHRNGIYSAVAQANEIVEYVKNSRNQRDKNKPFSMLWTMDPPHNPYDSLDDTDEAIYNQYYKHLDTKSLLNRPNVTSPLAEKRIKYYLSMITLIDREIGRVVKALEEQGMRDNTLILFTADHGEMMGSHGEFGKNRILEESLSIPFILNFPKKIKPRVDDLLISVPDFMPSLLGLVGESSRIPVDVQGSDYSSLFVQPQNRDKVRPNSSLYYGKVGELGIKTHEYTYGINKEGTLIALFDNKADPYQMNMLSLNSIPQQKALLLKEQLGCWISKIEHPWAEQQRFTKMITYPTPLSDCHMN